MTTHPQPSSGRPGSLHVLVVSLVYPPDNVSTAQIVGDLVADLITAGARVTVLTTMPHYNPPAESPVRFRTWLGPFVQRSEQRGADVYHCAMPRKGSGVAGRLAAWLGFHIVSTLIGLVCVRRAHVLFAPSPPLSIGVSAWILGLRHRAPYVYNVQEIYPDIAVKLGAIREGRALELLKALERFVYRRAAAVTVIAPRMRARLLEKGVPASKVSVVPNFVDVSELRPSPKDNAFSRAHGLAGTFVVSYAGNLGPAQGLDAILDAARALRELPGVRFLIAGDGILRGALAARIAREDLRNVLMLDYLPFSVMIDLYATSDISLVPLAPDAAFDAIPSKVYRIMACARPVVALSDPDSDLSALIEAAGAGAVVPAGDAAALAAVIREASASPEAWQRKGAAGRAHVLAHFERSAVTSQYFALLQATARGARD